MHLNGDVLAYWMMEFFSRPSLPLLIDSHYSLHGSCIYLLSLHTEGISSKTIIPPPAPIIINISLVNAINMKWNQVSQKDLILHVFKWFALGRGEKWPLHLEHKFPQNTNERNPKAWDPSIPSETADTAFLSLLDFILLENKCSCYSEGERKSVEKLTGRKKKKNDDCRC